MFDICFQSWVEVIANISCERAIVRLIGIVRHREPRIRTDFVCQPYHDFDGRAFAGHPGCICQAGAVRPVFLVGTVRLHPVHKSDLASVTNRRQQTRVKHRTSLMQFFVFFANQYNVADIVAGSARIGSTDTKIDRTTRLVPKFDPPGFSFDDMGIKLQVKLTFTFGGKNIVALVLCYASLLLVPVPNCGRKFGSLENAFYSSILVKCIFGQVPWSNVPPCLLENLKGRMNLVMLMKGFAVSQSRSSDTPNASVGLARPLNGASFACA